MPNIFQTKLADTPREALNSKLWTAVLCFGLMGAARGIDEGLISGTLNQKAFIAKYGLEDPNLSASQKAQRIGNIAAMVQIGSVAGALIAFLLCDRIGRVWATRQLCLVWIFGIVIFLTSQGRLGQVYAGRFIAGIGIGQTTVVAPTYLVEVSPRSIRGLCTCAFSGAVYLGIMLAYFASWGSALHISNKSDRQWIIPTTMHIMFAGIIFCLTFFIKESPRYLEKVGKHDLALRNMANIRNLPEDHPYVQSEIIDIRDQLEREKEATHGSGWLGPFKEILYVPSNRYRLFLAIMIQLLSQWSGASSITIYAPEFFKLLGVAGQNEKLFATAIFGVVKLISSLICALFLVDIVGRKRALQTGITLQFISMLYIAIYLAAVPTIEDGKVQTGSAKAAGTGAIVMIYFSGAGWALGWNSVQYLINAEIFPLRVRGLGSSLTMCFHFINQYANSKAVPSMLLPGAMKPVGTFFFFATVTGLGLAWVWFFLPETAGKSLEAMDGLFDLPWYLIGRKGAKLTAGQGSLAEAIEGNDTEKVGQIEMIEDAKRRQSNASATMRTNEAHNR